MIGLIVITIILAIIIGWRIKVHKTPTWGDIIVIILWSLILVVAYPWLLQAKL